MRVRTTMTAAFLLAAPTAALADDQPYLDDLAVTIGRIAHRDGGTFVNVSLKSAAPVRLRYVSIDCAALDAKGDNTETAPVTLQNVPPGATVHGSAIFTGGGAAKYDCRVESYDE